MLPSQKKKLKIPKIEIEKPSPRFADYLQVIFYLFLFISSAGLIIISFIATPRRSTNLSDADDIINNKILKDICLPTFYDTFNKPADVSLEIQKDEIVPKSCLTKPSSRVCHQHTAKLKFFTPRSNDVITRLRKSAALKDNIFLTKNQLLMPKIMQDLNATQKMQFLSFMDQIAILNSAQLNQQILKTYGSGYCREHTDNALITILKRLSKKQLPYMHVIEVASKLKKPLDSHIFLVLGIKQQDIEIKENPEEVSQLLQKLAKAKGVVCDPWNKDFLLLSESNLHTNTKWHSLKITGISLNFQHLQELPQAAQEFICSHLQQIDQDLIAKSSCHFLKK